MSEQSLSRSSSRRKKSSDHGHEKKKKIKSIANYTLGDVLGKGGFGVVYRGLNQNDGSQVAVKQVSLKKCSKEQVEDIHSEINLLKKLHHDLIVRYIDHKQSKTKLYIIIEFVEGGSLQDQMKKYGTFKESLVAKYIKQVLIGLNYLHNEGVIHRDIKGANILTTKDGGIKLADFGVAAALSEAESENPVGTPYWMAPEIIEMSPATPKSDIWSVGATVIELLTGEPPYFKLDPMPALYRIVQDESPPIPECSKICEDFLYKCFQKDPDLRNSAEILLKHPWITVNNGDVSKEEEEKKKMEAEAAEKEKLRLEEERKKQESRMSAEKKLQLLQFAEDEDDTDSWGDFGDDEPIPVNLGLQFERQEDMNSPSPSNARKSMNMQNLKFDKILNAQKQLDDDDEDSDYDDLFGGDPFADDEEELEDVDFAQKLRQKMTLNNIDDDDDPFQDDMDEFADFNFESTPKDEEIRMETKLRDLFATLDINKHEAEIVDICTKLCEGLNQFPKLKTKITQSTGAASLRELMESDNCNVLLHTLKVINSIVIVEDISQTIESRTFCETLCLLGIIPPVMQLASESYDMQLRQETCAFIYEICNVSALTLQMFIACRGLPTLVKFLVHNETNFSERSDIIFSAVDAILRVFNIPDPNNTRKPKNDFCALFCKAQLMPQLSSVLIQLAKDSSLRSKQYLDRVITILLLFSNAGPIVLSYMSQGDVLPNLLKSIKLLENKDIRLNMVKCVKNLALNPATFDNFVKSDGIPRLVELLAERDEDISNQVIAALYSLTLVNRERQNIAVQAGIVPELQHAIETDSPLKYLALSLICMLAHASNIAREELWKNDGVRFFIKILRINGYQVNALEALREWITEDTKRVQNELCRKENIEELVSVFSSASRTVFASMLEPLQNILNVSVKVNKALSNTTEFVSKLMKQSLLQPQPDAQIRIRVMQLKIVQSLYRWCDHPKRMMADLYPVIKQIAQQEKGILVNEIAMNLLSAFETNIKL